MQGVRAEVRAAWAEAGASLGCKSRGTAQGPLKQVRAPGAQVSVRLGYGSSRERVRLATCPRARHNAPTSTY